jgi:hypothetical protein
MAGYFVEDIDVPNKTIKTLGDSLRAMGIPVTNRQLYHAQWDEENPLEPTRIGNANRFSVRDGLKWIEGQKGRYRAGSRSAARVAEQSA